MAGYRLEGHIPNEFIGVMLERLVRRHPLPGKILVYRGLTAMSFPALTPTGGKTAQGRIHFSSGPELLVEVCFGTPENPMPMYDAMQTIAHEYRHALQIYRDGLKYGGKYDKKLEDDADAFARAERKAMWEAGYDYLHEQDKAKGWRY